MILGNVPLSGDLLPGRRLVALVPLHHALHHHGLGGADHEHLAAQVVQVLLEQQRDVQHHHARPLPEEGVQQVAHERALNVRAHELVQEAQLVGLAKHQVTKLLAIQSVI